jgi:hypothetical protein
VTKSQIKLIINLISEEFCFISVKDLFKGYCESRPERGESSTGDDEMNNRAMKDEVEGVEVE